MTFLFVDRLLNTPSTTILSQAHLKLQHHNEHIAESSKDAKGSSFVQICKDVISAFQNLRRLDKHMEMLPIGKQALFTAASIVSTKS
ncbi:hypothetical protein AQUCO_01500425v1 [Aquilegia coerulea]|uniref:Uncharacterized protein n=1 Tax=Aquilegia coerulea TaxID=218851 RepID=A0A2G5DTM1_AQUCA|nr:hypothetical protein AQUCO_01500425v1 [Aquilegia coerulea]